MKGFLRIEKVSSGAIIELLRESSLLTDSNEEEFMKILLCLYIRRASFLNDRRSHFVHPDSPLQKDSENLLQHWLDQEWLTIELGCRAQAFANRLTEELADTKCTISITETSMSIIIRNTQCTSISNCICIEAPKEEGATERCNLEYSIENCLEGEIQTFGPMLSGYVFGRVHDGASRSFLCGKHPVTLQFSDEKDSTIEFATQALRRAIARAEENSLLMI